MLHDTLWDNGAEKRVNEARPRAHLSPNRDRNGDSMVGSLLDWTSGGTLSKHLAELQRDSLASYQANPRLIEEHANHEEQISVGGYAQRVIRELVQNAADAMAGGPTGDRDHGQIEVVLNIDTRRLYVANGGLPVSRKGLDGLTHAHLSDKRGDEIGKFGLGFKSVLSVCEQPEVFSRTVSFQFGQTQSITTLRDLRPGLTKYPTLRIASEVDPVSSAHKDPILASLMKSAATVVRLSNLSGHTSLVSEIQNFHGLFLLFVERVELVRFTIISNGVHKTTEHRSQHLHTNRYMVTHGSGDTSEWLVKSIMHRPSAEARKEAGTTVTRDRVKISTAIPVDRTKLRVGEFWSYFPLRDKTSASGIFNAPWSLVDDRSSMLDNTYNREIEDALIGLYANTLKDILDQGDPGSILEYLPSRPREHYSQADARFRAKMPGVAAREGLIPDVTGALRRPDELIPLEFGATLYSEMHRDWQRAANTDNNVPHWTCYQGRDRPTRLRDIFVAQFADLAAAPAGSDAQRAMEKVRQRGFSSWFRMWATEATGEVSLDVLKAAARLAQESRHYRTALEATSFIPSDSGLNPPSARTTMFIKGADGYVADGFSFVSERLSAQPGAHALLREFGIVELDARTKIKSQLKQINGSTPVSTHQALWNALAEDLPLADSKALVAKHGRDLLVPTLAREWLPAAKVIDVPELRTSERAAQFLLDEELAPHQLAQAIGVRNKMAKTVGLSDEPLGLEYEHFVLSKMNANTEPGERGVEAAIFSPPDGPGPVSVLGLLASAGASEKVRAKWTKDLLSQPCVAQWEAFADNTSDVTITVDSPQVWAVTSFGLVESSWGHRSPMDAVSPKLLEFRDLLPRCTENPQLVAVLGLPESIDSIPIEKLESYFGEAIANGQRFPDLAAQRNSGEVLERFCLLTAARYREAGLHLTHLPAYRGTTIELCPVNEIYVGSGVDQLTYLHKRNRAFLRPYSSTPIELAKQLGVRDFAEVFSFEVVSTGRAEPELAIDRFRGLASYPNGRHMRGKYLIPCEDIRKETTTPDGLMSETLSVFHSEEASEILVRNTLDDAEILNHLSSIFLMGLTHADIEDIQERVTSDELQLMRVEARSLASDGERLEHYLGKQRLLESLPKGLWDGLQAQDAVSEETSIGELCLMVHGSSTLKVLRDQLRDIGFKDVPTSWGRNRATKSWLDDMGFGQEFAPETAEGLSPTLVVEGAVDLPDLHDFQRRVADLIQDNFISRDPDGRAKKMMVDMPTGVGKTRVAVQSILELFISGKLQGPVLWIAESQELCEQAVQTWRYVWRGLLDENPLTVSRLWGSNSVPEPGTEFSVVVATDAKLYSLINNERHAVSYSWLQDATAVVVDEAHRSGTSPMYTTILGWLGIDGRRYERPLVGLSATPFKGGDASTQQLAQRYGNNIIPGFTSPNPFSEATTAGYLARVDHMILDGIRVNLNESERATASKGLVSKDVLDRIGGDQDRMSMVVDHIRYGTPSDWPVLVFTPSVVSAQVLAATLQYFGIPSASVSGDTSRSERRRIIGDFKEGRIRVLTNCDLLVQGFDAPGVRSLIIARPTFSRGSYIQMVGRGLRGEKNGGKTECRIVDIQDNFGDAQELLDHLNYVDLWEKKIT